MDGHLFSSSKVLSGPETTKDGSLFQRDAALAAPACRRLLVAKRWEDDLEWGTAQPSHECLVGRDASKFNARAIYII